MSDDVEDVLRATFGRHADQVADAGDPVPELERRLRRRTLTRAAAATATAAAVAAVVAVGVAMAPGSTGSTPAPVGPAASNASSAPAQTQSSGTDLPSSSNPLTGHFSRRPKPTRTGNGLVPADTNQPGAGACEPARGAVAEVDLEPDAPAPHCLLVTASMKVKVVNRSDDYGQPGKPTVVRFADFAPVTLQSGQSVTYPDVVGSYLTSGVHFVHADLYSGNGAAVWLR